MKKNVWLLNHYANLPERGASLRHYNFAKELVKRGYSVSIFASSAAHNSDYNAIEDKRLFLEEEMEGVHFVYVRTDSYKGNRMGRIRNIMQYCLRTPRAAKCIAGEQGEPDVIIGSSMHPFTLFMGRRMSKRYKCTYIEEIRDLWPESLIAYVPDFNRFVMAALYKAEKYIYKRADRIIFTMAGGKDYIKDKGWQDEIHADKLHHINNGVDLEAFYINRERFQIDDADLADDKSFKVVYTGSVRAVNNLGVLVETAARLEALGKTDIKILIWGEGNELSGLVEEASRRGLMNIIFKGYVKKEYIPYIVSMANINIIHQAQETRLYKYGSSQNKKFDYLAAGKPVLCTVKSNYDIIVEGKAGISLEVQNPETICGAILRFYNMSSAEYGEYCKNATALAGEYDFKKLSDILVDIIESAPPGR